MTLSASTAFASFWMVPRLQKFRDELPGIDLRIQTADRDLDLVAEGIPLGIRGGSAEDWPDYDLLTIAPEEIYAVAGPAYVARSGMPRTLADLANERLIHLEEPFRPAANWNEWFQSAGFDGAVVSRGLLINDYVLGDPGRHGGPGRGARLAPPHRPADRQRAAGARLRPRHDDRQGLSCGMAEEPRAVRERAPGARLVRRAGVSALGGISRQAGCC